MRLNKRLVSLALAAATLTSVFAANAYAAEYDLIISHTINQNSPEQRAYTYFKDLIEEKSEGRIAVTIYPNKEIATSDNENAELVSQNIAQISAITPGVLYSTSNIKGFNIFDYPYLMETYDEIYEVVDGPVMDDLSAQLEEATGIKIFGGFIMGWCLLGSVHNEVTDANSVKGQKIRTIPSLGQAAIMEKLDASSYACGFGDLIPALQQKTVDGVFTSSNLLYTEGVSEICHDYINPKAITIIQMLVVNADWYNSLPDDLKAVFDECAAELNRQIRENDQAYEQEAIDLMISEDGCTVLNDPSDEVIAEFKEKLSPIIEEQPDIAGADVVNAVKEQLGK